MPSNPAEDARLNKEYYMEFWWTVQQLDRIKSSKRMQDEQLADTITVDSDAMVD